MWEIPNAYEDIDLILDLWASENGLTWQKEYKDYSVRSYSFPLGGNETVQFWVDPPSNAMAVVHVALNSSLANRRRHEQAAHPYIGLSTALDDALRTAREWKTNASS